MSETSGASADKPAVSNIAGIAMVIIIVALTSVTVYQQGQLAKSVETLAIVSAKCTKQG